MNNNLRLAASQPYPMGVKRTSKGIRVCAVYSGKKDCGIILYRKNDRKGTEIIFSDDFRYGKIFCAEIIGDTDVYTHYMLIEEGKLFADPYACYIEGLEKWGKNVKMDDLSCRIDRSDYDWGQDVHPGWRYEDSFIYTLHVRGYTKSPSSGIELKKRGTYKGIIEKIPYIKSLGVTAVEIMPTYEMNVLDVPKTGSTSNGGNMPEGSFRHHNRTSGEIVYSENGSIKSRNSIRQKINFWGYKQGYYFAPRTAYAVDTKNADLELKDMIREMHKNGLEVILQFYFAEDDTEDIISAAIRHWVFEYHIDGVHMKGSHLAPAIVAADPALSDIKIWYYGFDYGRLYSGKAPEVRTLAEFKPDFMYASRRFLKGDDNSLGDFIKAMLTNNRDAGSINYICDYEGFRLADLVSYEHKRNETNGENNTDGTDNNLSWNCGIEGKTRRAAILSLRNKQVKNALTMVMFSQGTPMIFGGDEFGNSQDGNNNPYCQDNATGWIDWSQADKTANIEITNYLRFLSKLRFKYRILHESKAFKLMDYKACGYPDLSYHGIEAWRPDLSNYSHSIGMLYCGLYEDKDKDQDFFYIAYNMHWNPVTFALPKLPDGMRWYVLNDTEETVDNLKMKAVKDQTKIECSERSIKILIGAGKPAKKADKKTAKSN
ncbi:alpha-amylase family glycosyl hydrolase [Butyrivibrio sp. WCE2006]|uniref:alpha-amylase family glycosyl hydrolase n=1 Tax=Butyrivibrio sp. WCE2006 TaxID=1410611 RepID=UPI00067853F3|nr:alpha-amylase family glycosyl hydrolase [Butyrivibrio sp. WCE2006]